MHHRLKTHRKLFVNQRHRMLVFSSACLVAALLAGVVLIAQGNARFGWWLVLIVIFGGLMVFATVYRGQSTLARLARQADGNAEPVDALRPVPLSEDLAVAKGISHRWTGAASVPAGVGYVEVSIFLAVAELGEQGFVLRVRPFIIRLMFGIENLTVRPVDGTVIYPARAFGRSGIEIRVSDRPSYYFWTGHRAELLASLAAAGFEVSAEEQRIRR